MELQVLVSLLILTCFLFGIVENNQIYTTVEQESLAKVWDIIFRIYLNLQFICISEIKNVILMNLNIFQFRPLVQNVLYEKYMKTDAFLILWLRGTLYVWLLLKIIIRFSQILKCSYINKWHQYTDSVFRIMLRFTFKCSN